MTWAEATGYDRKEGLKTKPLSVLQWKAEGISEKNNFLSRKDHTEKIVTLPEYRKHTKQKTSGSL